MAFIDFKSQGQTMNVSSLSFQKCLAKGEAGESRGLRVKEICSLLYCHS